MPTVCADPDDFTTDSSGRLQLRPGCGIKRTDDGVAVNFDSADFTCEDDGFLRIRPGCGMVRTVDGIAARVSNTANFSDLAQTGNNALLANIGDFVELTNSLSMDFRDWCALPPATGAPIAALVNVESYFIISTPNTGWEATVTLERSVNGGPFVFRSTLWSSDEMRFGVYARRITISDALDFVGGAIRTVAYKMTITGNAPIAFTVTEREVRISAIAMTANG